HRERFRGGNAVAQADDPVSGLDRVGLAQAGNVGRGRRRMVLEERSQPCRNEAAVRGLGLHKVSLLVAVAGNRGIKIAADGAAAEKSREGDNEQAHGLRHPWWAWGADYLLSW